jgi:hypothetical protein
MRYEVDVITTGLFTGTLKARRLQETLNGRATQGWRFVRSITDERRSFLFFNRDAHFLIFERDD